MTNLTDLTTKTPASEIRKVAQSYGLVLVGNASYKGVKEQWIQQINDEVAAQQQMQQQQAQKTQEPDKSVDYEVMLALVAHKYHMKDIPVANYIASKLDLEEMFVERKLSNLIHEQGYLTPMTGKLAKLRLTNEGNEFMRNMLINNKKYAYIVDDQIVAVLTHEECNGSNPIKSTEYTMYKKCVPLNDRHMDPKFLEILTTNPETHAILKFWQRYYEIL